MVVEIHPPIKTQHRVAMNAGLYQLPPDVMADQIRFDYGYVRWSKEKTDDKNLTEIAQLASVRQMHAGFGTGRELKILADEGRSGRESKVHLRAAYQQLVADVEANRVHTIYAAYLTRLGRGLQEGIRLLDLCDRHRVRVITNDFGVIDRSNANGILIFNLLMSVAEWEVNMAVERNASIVAQRLRAGDPVGQQNFGWTVDRADPKQPKVVEDPDEQATLARILELFRQTRMIRTVARQLNAEGHRARRGGLWSTTSVRGIIERHARELMPPKTERRVAVSAPYPLYRLLRCHCGLMLTGVNEGTGFVRYKCIRGGTAPGHGKRSISQAKVLEWVRAETARELGERLAGITATEIAAADDHATERGALLARRARVKQLFLEGELSKEERLAENNAIDTKIEALVRASQATAIPVAIDWDRWDAVHVNAVLRVLWAEIQLGPDLLPVHAVPAS